ncbi:Uma2 family endonuclease [Armatimonas rosea]|uniref:Uma2 family endonuclease n=1 Tax=Armatimonas rosea TaxID=685828 RepID=A0A7W9SM34_ARMRO|nr:Uma2 family endonuclease [Armatimonas rosea]MBB6049162.1 Uma2 family endonuclease [Armatimonas rosea]
MSANPTPFRWSVEAYERVVALGGFAPEQRIELIDGELVEIMPQKPRHSSTIELVEEACRAIAPEGYRVRVQLPLKFTTSVPEPDVAVVQGQLRSFVNSHPATAVLVVEVSDTTLEYDQVVKAPIYAAAGIEDYWIININERTVEVRRQPGPSGYRSLQTYTETDTVAPLFTTVPISVAELLP